jgi:ribosomal protein L37AE/L43A
MCALQCRQAGSLLASVSQPATCVLTRPPSHAACLPCLQFGMKRQVVGIWKCKACNKTQAGGAYVLK